MIARVSSIDGGSGHVCGIGRRSGLRLRLPWHRAQAGCWPRASDGRDRIRKGATRQAAKLNRDLFVRETQPGKSQFVLQKSVISMVGYPIAILAVLLCLTLGCDDPPTPVLDAEYQRQVDSFDRQTTEADKQLERSTGQLDETDEQLGRTAKQLDVTDRQLARAAEQLDETDQQLEKASRQADRFDNLLDKWESQAERQDRIFEAMERVLESTPVEDRTSESQGDPG